MFKKKKICIAKIKAIINSTLELNSIVKVVSN